MAKALLNSLQGSVVTLHGRQLAAALGSIGQQATVNQLINGGAFTQQTRGYKRGLEDRYQINYEAFRASPSSAAPAQDSPSTHHHHSPDGSNGGSANGGNAYLRALLPETVQRNVKNVVGWRGAAERGFLAEYPDLIHVLAREGSGGNESLTRWYTKVLTQNLSSSSVGSQRFGILVPITYRQLNRDADRERMRQAHVLGWGVEIARAANFLTNQLVNADKKSSNPEEEAEVTWAARHGLGSMAVNDVLLLQNSIHIMLENYLRSDPSYSHYLDSFLYALRSNNLGRVLSFDDHPSQKPGLSGFDMKTYKAMVENNVSNTSYCLPIGLALHMAGLNEAKVHKQAKDIFNEIGYYATVNRDYAACFLDPRARDIERGKLTWMIVLALQRAGTTQRQELEACYGTGRREDANRVKAIYKELNLTKIFTRHVEEKQADILDRIQGISKLDKVGLSQEFFFKLVQNMDENRIS